MPRVKSRISDGRARRIASDWHGGQGSALYMFASTGATRDKRYTVEDVRIAIEYQLLPHIVADSERHWPHAGEELRELYAYVKSVGNRGPVEGWSDHWDD